MKREILALASQLKNFSQVAGAVETPKARRGKAKPEVTPAPEAMLTMADVEAVSEITEEIQFKTGEYTLSQIVAVGDVQNELYLAECAVVAAAIVRLDQDGEVAAHGTPAINYPGFDPTFESLTDTGQLAPALVKAIMVEFHPTSAASRGMTPATKAASSTS